MRLALVILAVDDPDRAAAFYQAALGFPVRERVPVYVELDASPIRLGLYRREGFAQNVGGAVPVRPPDGGLSSAELYLHVDDPAPAAARLLEAGARPLSPLAPRPWGDEAAYFADLDGNVVVVARPL